MIANSIRACFPAAAQVVADKADEINKLNVFPVPDGDTGTNMSLTLGTVVKEIQSLPEGASMAAVAKAITHGSLMGARGNSGVITSQILRGIAEGLVGAKGPDATAADIAAALRTGVKPPSRPCASRSRVPSSPCSRMSPPVPIRWRRPRRRPPRRSTPS